MQEVDVEKGSYLAGFADGEGCFYVGVHPTTNVAPGLQVIPEFHVSQRWLEENFRDSVLNERSEIQKASFDESSAKFRTLRDYMPSASTRGEDIVRTAWRHAEAGRNDLPGSGSIRNW